MAALAGYNTTANAALVPSEGGRAAPRPSPMQARVNRGEAVVVRAPVVATQRR